MAECPGRGAWDTRGGIRGCLLKISILSKGERQDRTSERDEVVVVVGLLDRAYKGEATTGTAEKERDRERNGLTVYRKIKIYRNSMGYIHTHMLKSWNSPARTILRSHLVQTFHVTREYTETQRRCDLLEVP